jgi:hypothetical protein
MQRPFSFKVPILTLLLWLISAVNVSAVFQIPTGNVNIFIFSGKQGWTDVVGSTDTPPAPEPVVSLSSFTVLQADPLDCYMVSIKPNGTTSSDWVPCPK